MNLLKNVSKGESSESRASAMLIRAKLEQARPGSDQARKGFRNVLKAGYP